MKVTTYKLDLDKWMVIPMIIVLILGFFTNYDVTWWIVGFLIMGMMLVKKEGQTK